MRERKTCFRFFGGFLQAQENWLNRMAGRGYRLVSVGKLGYRFQTCPPDTVEYRVEWIGHKSPQDARAYQQFLEELGYRVWVKNVNLNCSVGKIRFRPWADPGGKLAGNRSTFNRELLLVERERDGDRLSASESLQGDGGSSETGREGEVGEGGMSVGNMP